MVGAVVIVGAGRCGASAAETLRGAGFDGRVVLVGDEAEPPYERPPLSKAFLAGAQDAADLSVHPRSWYADSGVELRTAVAVTGLDCRSRLALLSDGSQVGFDRLLPATGGRPRLLPGSSSLQRVRYLRTLADATSLRSSLTAASHVVVVGAGFIGAEVAASARSLGVSVTLLEMLEVPLARVLGSEVGAAYADLHRAHGVRLLTGEGLASVQECDDGAVRVRTTRDRDLECDLVVVGVGIEPRDELAAAAGLTVSNGVLVDEYCRTASRSSTPPATSPTTSTRCRARTSGWSTTTSLRFPRSSGYTTSPLVDNFGTVTGRNDPGDGRGAAAYGVVTQSTGMAIKIPASVPIAAATAFSAGRGSSRDQERSPVVPAAYVSGMATWSICGPGRGGPIRSGLVGP